MNNKLRVIAAVLLISCALNVSAPASAAGRHEAPAKTVIQWAVVGTAVVSAVTVKITQDIYDAVKPVVVKEAKKLYCDVFTCKP